MVTIEIKIVMSTSHVNYHYALIRVTMCKQPLCLDLSAWLRGCGWVGGGGRERQSYLSLFPHSALSTSRAVAKVVSLCG